MNYSVLDYQKEDSVAIVTLNRPESLNALNKKVFDELGLIFDEIEKDYSIKVVLLTGSGKKAFAAGADVTEIRHLSPLEARKYALEAYQTQDKISGLPKPTVAVLNGLTLGGGCELAMCCDLRIASDTAKLGQPEINLALIPGGGGTQRLCRLIGESRAKELLFTGKIISAKQALEWGLVNRVFPQENLMAESLKFAREIAGKSSPALELIKAAANRGINMDLKNALLYEIECFGSCFNTEDHLEGISALLEKRKPIFLDK